MNYENILDKFSNISDLPVSEEAIGAYLEGNLSLDEQLEVEASLTGSGNEDILTDITLDEPMPADDLTDDILAIDVLDDNIQLPDVNLFEDMYAGHEDPNFIELSMADADYAECALPDSDIDELNDDLLPGDDDLDLPAEDSDSDFPDPLDF